MERIIVKEQNITPQTLKKDIVTSVIKEMIDIDLVIGFI